MEATLFKIATAWVTAICENPSILSGALIVFAVCKLLTNGIRMAWPKEMDRPRVVCFLIGLLDLGALNLWNFVGLFRKPDFDRPLSMRGR